MDNPNGSPYCQTHKSMLSCLETVVGDVHLDLTSIDYEVNKCLPTTYQLPGNMITPPFFKEPVNNALVSEGLLPVIAELTKSHPLTIHSNTCGTSCIPRLPTIILSIEKEVDRHVQYVNYINEKMNTVPMSTHTAKDSMITSRSRLPSTSSDNRNKIRTNPSLPVLRRTPKVNNLSMESCDITSVSQQWSSSMSSIESIDDASVQSGPSCLCCSKCFEVLQLFSDSISSKIQYIKDNCHDLQNRLSAELKEKEKELMVQLAQTRKAKQTVCYNFSRLEGLGLQALSVCSNIQMFEPVYSNHGNQTNTRYAADGQSCDESTHSNISDTCTQSIPAAPSDCISSTQSMPETTDNSVHSTQSMPDTTDYSISSTQSGPTTTFDSTSSTQSMPATTRPTPSGSDDTFPCTQSFTTNNSTNSTVQSITASSSAGAYSISLEPTLPAAPQVSSCSEPESIQSQNNIYDEPVSSVKEVSPDFVPCSTTPKRPHSLVPESPMPELLEFQRRRSNSMNQNDNTLHRDHFRQRSHTVSHAAPATRPTQNQYATIDETPENSTCTTQTKDMLLHVKSNIGVTFDDMKPKKLKKSKSSIMVRATKLKNFITKKFTRKSWEGSAARKSLSPTSVQASSTGIQFFEYDFSDDDSDNGSDDITSHSLCDLSQLTGAADTLTSSANGVQGAVQKPTRMVPEMTFTSNGSNNTSIIDQIANIEKQLHDTTTSNKPDQPPVDSRQIPITSTVCKSSKPVTTVKSSFSSQKNGHVQLYIPSLPQTNTDYHLEDLLTARTSFDMSGIEPTAMFQIEEPNTVSLDHSYSSSQPLDASQASSRKRLIFETTTNATTAVQSIFSFHEDSTFDIQQGYTSFRKIQKIASTPCQPTVSHSTAHKSMTFFNMPGRHISIGGHLQYQEPELLTHLCQGQTSYEGRRNMEKLCHLKPYLLHGKLSLSRLLYLIDNYPHNMTEIPCYNHGTKQISHELVFHVSNQTCKPHIFARNLVWHLFSLAELFGGTTDTLNTDIIIDVREVTVQYFNLSIDFWQSRCISFIEDSINYLFQRKLRHPVFRSLLQQSDC